MAISSDKILGQNREINQFITRCAGFHFEIAFSALTQQDLRFTA